MVVCACGPTRAGEGGASGSGAGGGSAGGEAGSGAHSVDRDAGTLPPPQADASRRPPPDAAAPQTDAGCAPPPGTVPYADRNDNGEFTDPADCPGCPGAFQGPSSLDVPMLAPDATTVPINGVAAGATRCDWYVIGGSCGVTHGVAASDPDSADRFSATLPVFCGTNVIRIVCSNAAGSRVLVRRLMGTQCAGRDLRLTLSWDDQGRDMELHLVRPGGHLNNPAEDCTWFTCDPPLDLPWGTDATQHPHKDVDNTQTFGPENIYLEHAAPGVYHVFVEYWGSGNPSTNFVDVTIHEATVARLMRPMLAVHQVWHVGTVSFPDGLFSPIDRVIDCAMSWHMTTMGCDLPLP